MLLSQIALGFWKKIADRSPQSRRRCGMVEGRRLRRAEGSPRARRRWWQASHDQVACPLMLLSRV
jgi:hypothetical protein